MARTRKTVAPAPIAPAAARAVGFTRPDRASAALHEALEAVDSLREAADQAADACKALPRAFRPTAEVFPLDEDAVLRVLDEVEEVLGVEADLAQREAIKRIVREAFGDILAVDLADVADVAERLAGVVRMQVLPALHTIEAARCADFSAGH